VSSQQGNTHGGAEDMKTPSSGQVLYVSWGGTGRSASLRSAFRQAAERGGPLVYLAVLDNSTFGDVDDDMGLVVADELEWLLDAQVNLTRTQLGIEDMPVRVAVRRGEVIDEIAAAVDTLGEALILLGAPVPVAGHASLEDLVSAVSNRTGQPTELALPED
jgi:hypothetical protein